jgi:hypothetical protein
LALLFRNALVDEYSNLAAATFALTTIAATMVQAANAFVAAAVVVATQMLVAATPMLEIVITPLLQCHPLLLWSKGHQYLAVLLHLLLPAFLQAPTAQRRILFFHPCCHLEKVVD